MATMLPEVAVRQALLTDSAITDVIGAGASANMWCGYAPQNTGDPFIIIRRASTTLDYSTAGATGMRDMEIDVWITGKDYETITDLGEAVIQRMHTSVHRQTITSGDDSIAFKKCFMTDMADEQEAIDDATGRPIRRVFQRWRLNHQYE